MYRIQFYKLEKDALYFLFFYILERKINTLLIFGTRKYLYCGDLLFFFLKNAFILLILSKLRIFRKLFSDLIFRQIG